MAFSWVGPFSGRNSFAPPGPNQYTPARRPFAEARGRSSRSRGWGTFGFLRRCIHPMKMPGQNHKTRIAPECEEFTATLKGDDYFG
jgi:hypothetical protein